MKIITPISLSILIGCGQQGLDEKQTSAAKGTNDNNEPIPVTLAEVEEHYKSLESLVYDSTLVAVVKAKDEPEEISYKGATFITNQLDVKEVILGDENLEQQNIKLLEIGMGPTDLNVVNGPDKFLLFLEKYEGPVTDNAYSVNGVYQGKFRVKKDGSLEYGGKSVQGVNYFQDDFANNYKLSGAKKKINEAKKKIKNTKDPKQKYNSKNK